MDQDKRGPSLLDPNLMDQRLPRELSAKKLAQAAALQELAMQKAQREAKKSTGAAGGVGSTSLPHQGKSASMLVKDVVQETNPADDYEGHTEQRAAKASLDQLDNESGRVALSNPPRRRLRKVGEPSSDLVDSEERKEATTQGDFSISSGGSQPGALDLADMLGGLALESKQKSLEGGPTEETRPVRKDHGVSAVPPHKEGRRDQIMKDKGAHGDGILSGKEDMEKLVLGEGNFVLPGATAKMLYEHQKGGLKWLWSLHAKGTGGILGDDMGLGKTMQIAAFLAGLLHSRSIKRALVVAPGTLLAQWVLELNKCGLGRKTRKYHQGSATERDYNLQRTLQTGGVLLTTYGMVRSNADALQGMFSNEADGEREGNEAVTWDYVILDEGHQIKNTKTAIAQRLREIPALHRIIVTGTPIQNNFKEMWALFDFCCSGLLGDEKQFSFEFNQRLIAGSDKDATERQKEVARATAQRLRAIIAPYFLRREKAQVFGKGADSSSSGAETPANSGADSSGAASSSTKEAPKMGKKNDLIVWLPLTTQQRRLYISFLHSQHVRKVLNKTNSALAALTVLKKICDHPMLLTEKTANDIAQGASKAKAKGAFAGTQAPGDNNVTEDDVEAAAAAAIEAARHSNIRVEGQGAASCKVAFLMNLLDDLVANGHRTLVFSQSRTMLDIIEEEVRGRNLEFCRIDGSVLSTTTRQSLVEEFQTRKDIPVFLLTSQVGGLGLTLTAADRVVIVDPAWNPSVDNQSVDRAYRIGQKKDVVVYRLITCGTVEEKIYRKQVFKGGLFRTATEHKDQQRYFNQSELRELFSIPDSGFDRSQTQEHLHAQHHDQLDISSGLAEHMASLELKGIAGISHHDLLFSKHNGIVAPGSSAGANPSAQRGAQGPSAAPYSVDLTGSESSPWRGGRAAAQQAWSGGVLNSALAALPSGSSNNEALELMKLEAKQRGLYEQLSRARQMIGNEAMRQTLPDGGAKLLANKERLEAEVAQANQRIAQLRATAQPQSAILASNSAPGSAGMHSFQSFGNSHGSFVQRQQKESIATHSSVQPAQKFSPHVSLTKEQSPHVTRPASASSVTSEYIDLSPQSSWKPAVAVPRSSAPKEGVVQQPDGVRSRVVAVAEEKLESMKTAVSGREASMDDVLVQMSKLDVL